MGTTLGKIAIMWIGATCIVAEQYQQQRGSIGEEMSNLSERGNEPDRIIAMRRLLSEYAVGDKVKLDGIPPTAPIAIHLDKLGTIMQCYPAGSSYGVKFDGDDTLYTVEREVLKKE